MNKKIDPADIHSATIPTYYSSRVMSKVTSELIKRASGGIYFDTVQEAARAGYYPDTTGDNSQLENLINGVHINHELTVHPDRVEIKVTGGTHIDKVLYAPLIYGRCNPQNGTEGRRYFYNPNNASDISDQCIIDYTGLGVGEAKIIIYRGGADGQAILIRDVDGRTKFIKWGHPGGVPIGPATIFAELSPTITNGIHVSANKGVTGIMHTMYTYKIQVSYNDGAYSDVTSTLDNESYDHTFTGLADGWYRYRIIRYFNGIFNGQWESDKVEIGGGGGTVDPGGSGISYSPTMATNLLGNRYMRIIVRGIDVDNIVDGGITWNKPHRLQTPTIGYGTVQEVSVFDDLYFDNRYRKLNDNDIEIRINYTTDNLIYHYDTNETIIITIKIRNDDGTITTHTKKFKMTDNALTPID